MRMQRMLRGAPLVLADRCTQTIIIDLLRGKNIGKKKSEREKGEG